jgi:hypothetical protein
LETVAEFQRVKEKDVKGGNDCKRESKKKSIERKERKEGKMR